MSECVCSICKNEVNSATAAILVIGSHGNPRYLCNECEKEIDTATTACEYEQIKYAVNRISDKMINSTDSEKLVVDTVTDMLADAKERAIAIAEGTYDFSEDECSTEITSNEASEEEDDYFGEQIRDFNELQNASGTEKSSRISKILDLSFGIAFAVVLLAAIGFLIYNIIT